MKRISLILFLSAAAFAAPAPALGRLANVSVIDRATQSTLPVYYAQGTYWVAGTPGGRYGLIIRNNTGERVLAVTSVDGVNVVTGETAAIGQTGYVLSAYERCEIDGWRKSDSEIATFEFTAAPQSYAQRTGRPANIGVIGVAVFRERPLPPPAPLVLDSDPAVDAPASRLAPATPSTGRETASSAAPAGSSSLLLPRRRDTTPLGTGHGERETSVIAHTQFDRASDRPDEVLRVRYDSYEHLVALGVIRRPLPRVAQPDAFPGSPTLGYVPDPPR